MLKNPFLGKKQVMSRSRSTSIQQTHSLLDLHTLFLNAKRAEGLRTRTLSDHTTHFRYFTDWLVEEGYDPSKDFELSIELLRNYVSYMQEELEIQSSTVNIRLKTLRCFLKFPNDEEYIKENLANKIKLVKTDVDTIKILSPEQVEALLRVIDKKSYTGYRDYVFIMLLLDTGGRIQEIASLTKAQIDFKASTIYLQATKVKTRIGRTVPLSQKVNKILFNLVTENGRYFNRDEVFLSVYGTPFQSGSFRKRLTTYKNKAKIEGARVSPHSFRHYFAKNYILNGGDPFTLQRILGHSDMQMLRKYINMFESDVKIQHNQYSPIQRLKL